MKKLLGAAILSFLVSNQSFADHGIVFKNHDFIKPCIIILVLSLVYIAWFYFVVFRKTKNGETTDTFEAISFIFGPGLIFVISLITAFVSGFILLSFYFWPVVIAITIFVLLSLVGTHFLEKRN